MPTTEHQLGPNPAMVIITRFTQTKERTEIHPGPWGTLYPDITREQAILRPCQPAAQLRPPSAWLPVRP